MVDRPSRYEFVVEDQGLGVVEAFDEGTFVGVHDGLRYKVERALREICA